MGIKTDIEWTDSSLQLQMGCNGCELWNEKAGVEECYAGLLTRRWGGKKGWPAAFDQPALFLERLPKALKWPDLTGTERPSKPWLNGYPRTIFLDDMGDTFTESLPLDWLAPHIPDMEASPHIWQILTKRPLRMLKFFQEYGRVPDNFWLMTSITSQKTISRSKPMAKLRELFPNAVLGVSYEPAWGPVDWTGMEYLDWLIGGGQSGAKARPSHPDWHRAARDWCLANGVAYFLKQWGEWLPISHLEHCETYRESYGRYPEGYPDDLKKQRYTVKTGFLHGAGDFVDDVLEADYTQERNCMMMYRVGKHAAGRQLDGREWNQMPQRGRWGS